MTTNAVKSVIASNFTAATSNTNTNESVTSPEMIRAFDNTIVMRFIGRPLARVEIKVAPVACKVIDRTMTAAGSIAIRLGVACLAAAKRAHNSRLAKNSLEDIWERSEGSINTSQC